MNLNRGGVNPFHQKNLLKDYHILQTIGKGSYGKINLVQHKTTKRGYVLKSIYLRDQNESETALREVKMLQLFKSPFIVKYHDSFKDEKILYIIMEYCDAGDLYQHLMLCKKKKIRVSEEQILDWFTQITFGLDFIHKQNILHRDIKAQNIFLTKKNCVKLGDLGDARSVKNSPETTITLVGTPYYMSPELSQNKHYGYKSDMWAMGCLLYEMCTYQHPFEAPDYDQLMRKIAKGLYDPIPSFYSKDLSLLVERMLSLDPEKRPTTTDILSMPYVRHRMHAFLSHSLGQKLTGHAPQSPLSPLLLPSSSCTSFSSPCPSPTPSPPDALKLAFATSTISPLTGSLLSLSSLDSGEGGDGSEGGSEKALSTASATSTYRSAGSPLTVSMTVNLDRNGGGVDEDSDVIADAVAGAGACVGTDADSSINTQASALNRNAYPPLGVKNPLAANNPLPVNLPLLAVNNNNNSFAQKKQQLLQHEEKMSKEIVDEGNRLALLHKELTRMTRLTRKGSAHHPQSNHHPQRLLHVPSFRKKNLVGLGPASASVSSDPLGTLPFPSPLPSSVSRSSSVPAFDSVFASVSASVSTSSTSSSSSSSSSFPSSLPPLSLNIMDLPPLPSPLIPIPTVAGGGGEVAIDGGGGGRGEGNSGGSSSVGADGSTSIRGKAIAMSVPIPESKSTLCSMDLVADTHVDKVIASIRRLERKRTEYNAVVEERKRVEDEETANEEYADQLAVYYTVTSTPQPSPSFSPFSSPTTSSSSFTSSSPAFSSTSSSSSSPSTSSSTFSSSSSTSSSSHTKPVVDMIQPVENRLHS